MDFYDILMVIVIGFLALGGVCFIACVVWAIWFECTRTIEPKSQKLSQMYRDTYHDDYDNYDEFCDTDTTFWMNQQYATQREQMRLDMENESRIVSDYLSRAEFDCMTAMHICEQDNDICHHANDLHNDMFSGGGNPFF